MKQELCLTVSTELGCPHQYCAPVLPAWTARQIYSLLELAGSMCYKYMLQNYRIDRGLPHTIACHTRLKRSKRQSEKQEGITEHDLEQRN